MTAADWTCLVSTDTTGLKIPTEDPRPTFHLTFYLKMTYTETVVDQ